MHHCNQLRVTELLILLSPLSKRRDDSCVPICPVYVVPEMEPRVLYMLGNGATSPAPQKCVCVCVCVLEGSRSHLAQILWIHKDILSCQVPVNILIFMEILQSIQLEEGSIEVG
jgi:hypothetical protein